MEKGGRGGEEGEGGMKERKVEVVYQKKSCDMGSSGGRVLRHRSPNLCCIGKHLGARRVCVRGCVSRATFSCRPPNRFRKQAQGNNVLRGISEAKGETERLVEGGGLGVVRYPSFPPTHPTHKPAPSSSPLFLSHSLRMKTNNSRGPQ